MPTGPAIGVTPSAANPIRPWVANSLLGWTYDPVVASGGFAPAAAFIYLCKMPVPETITITNILVYVTTAGTSYTNTQLGVYDSSGTYLSASAVLASGGTNTFGSTGVKTVPLQAAQTIVGGPMVFVWLAHHAGTNSATSFTFKNAGSDQVIINGGLTAATYRFTDQAGHATNNLATIGNLTPASNSSTPGTAMTWMGVS